MVAIGLAVRVLAGVLHDYGSTLSFCHEPGVAPEPRCHVTGISLVRAQGALEGPLADYIIDFFGRQNFAMIRGAMSFIYTWGGVAGPVAPPLFIIGLGSIAPCYGRS